MKAIGKMVSNMAVESTQIKMVKKKKENGKKERE